MKIEPVQVLQIHLDRLLATLIYQDVGGMELVVRPLIHAKITA